MRVLKNKLKSKKKSTKAMLNAEENAKKNPNLKYVYLTSEINVPSIYENPYITPDNNVNCENILETGDSGFVIADVVGGYQSSDQEETNDQLPQEKNTFACSKNEFLNDNASNDSNPSKTSVKLKICNNIFQSLENEKKINTNNILAPVPLSYSGSNFITVSTSSTSSLSIKPYKPKTLAEKQQLLEASRLPIMYFVNRKQCQENHDRILNYRNQLVSSKVPLNRETYNISSDITNMYSYIVRNGKRFTATSGKTDEVNKENRKTIFKVISKIESDDIIQQQTK